jgi:ribonucleotide reductase alpha subunit
MPKERGFDIMNIEISPKLQGADAYNSLVNDLEIISNNVDYQSIQTLPTDIKDKGVEMAEVYLYLYCIENTIRIFIENVCKAKYGENYFQSIVVSNSVRNSINTRKNEEQKNLWLSFRRGSSDLFYLDFSDLSAIITNNWDLFKQYFPEQAWISTKLTEMSKCRNLIAHNSYVGQHEKELMRLYYHSILKQINNV